MFHIIKAIIISLILLFVSFSSVNAIDICNKNTTEIADWTVILYLNGDNDLESKVKKVINNLETVGSTSDVNVIVQFDAFDLFEGIKRYHITKDDSNEITSTVVKTLDEESMGNSDTLANFVSWACENYPAEKYYVSLFDHGNGWRPRFMKDETDNDELDLEELETALTSVRKNIGRKIDLLSFDACLMGMAEVLYQLRWDVKVAIGSEDVVYGDGLPYHLFLSRLLRNPSMNEVDLAEIIVDWYSNFYSGFSMAMGAFYINSLKEEVIEKSLDNFAILLKNRFSQYKDEILDAIENTQPFNVFYNGEKIETNYRDLYDFAYEISIRIDDEEIDNAANKLMDDIETCTIKVQHNRKPDAHGISVYLPTSKKDYDSTYVNIDFTKNTNWDEFIDECLSKTRILFPILQKIISRLLQPLLKDNIL